MVAEGIIQNCVAGDFTAAHTSMESNLWHAGYSASDIIGTLFKVSKNHDMDESLKLKFIRVGASVRGPPIAQRTALRAQDAVLIGHRSSDATIWRVVLRAALQRPGDRHHAHAHCRRRVHFAAAQRPVFAVLDNLVRKLHCVSVVVMLNV